jgi:hypothetical protein
MSLLTLFTSPEKKVEKAIGFLNSPKSQQKGKPVRDAKCENAYMKAVSVVESHQELAVLKAGQIISNPKLDGCSVKKGEGTANLILSMSGIQNSDWIAILSDALLNKRPAVSTAAERVLSEMVKSGNQEALLRLADLIWPDAD